MKLSSLFLFSAFSLSCFCGSASALMIFSSDFTGGSGGVPAGWFNATGAGSIVESGSDVSMSLASGTLPVVLANSSTFDPQAATLTTLDTEVTSMVAEADAFLGFADGLGGAFVFDLNFSGGNLIVSSNPVGPFDVPTDNPPVTLLTILGYGGGSFDLSVEVDSDSYRVSSATFGVDTGHRLYAMDFPTYTNADLGSSALAIYGTSKIAMPFVIGSSSLDSEPTGGAPAVPEPSTAMPLILLLVTGSVVRRCRAKKNRTAE